MAEPQKIKKEELLLINWLSKGAESEICTLLCFVLLLAAIAQVLVGIVLIFSGGPNWPPVFFCLGSAVAAYFLAQQLRKCRISMYKEGLSFSLGFLFGLKFRLKRKWTDIGAIALHDESENSIQYDDEERRLIIIHFASGGQVKIPLRDLTVADLDSLFRASKRWGSTAVMAPELIELRRKLVAGPSPGMNLSLTVMWEKELQSHFTTSTFVPLATGSMLGKNRFQVISQLGAGGLSAIYLARSSDSRKVVLKELVLHKSSEAGINKAKELFQRERDLLRKLDHPQIAKVYDHFVENGRDYLVLEYIAGQSLRQLVESQGKCSEDKVLDWAFAVAGILHYLHKQKPPVVHRDISPENLLLGEDKLIHLIDFGAANEFVAAATGTLIGKQAYIAPEQFKGKPVPASDIYSLGATMYYLLTAQDPEALSCSNPAEVNSSVSVETGRFVALLTELDAGNRPSDCAEIMQMLSDLKASDRGARIVLGSS